MSGLHLCFHYLFTVHVSCLQLIELFVYQFESIHDARTCKIRTANNLRHDVQHIYNNIYLYLPNSILLTVTYTVVKPMKCAMLLLNVKACLYIGLVLPSSGAVLCIQVWCYCLGTGVPRYSAGGIHSSYVHVYVRV